MRTTHIHTFIEVLNYPVEMHSLFIYSGINIFGYSDAPLPVQMKIEVFTLHIFLQDIGYVQSKAQSVLLLTKTRVHDVHVRAV